MEKEQGSLVVGCWLLVVGCWLFYSSHPTLTGSPPGTLREADERVYARCFIPGNPYFTEAAGASTAVAHGGLTGPHSPKGVGIGG
jgi:hypothetical protein